MGKETELPKNIRQIGEVRGEEKICLEDYVMTCIHKKEQQEKEGYLGIFFGERRQEGEIQYVFIRGILELPGDWEAEHFAEKLEEQRKKYFPDWAVQGCCVIGTYDTDRIREVRTRIEDAGRIVYHLQEQEETLYAQRDGAYHKIKGYFIFYEQNRKMQAYLSEEFKEDRVEKESFPDKAIKSFREKVRIRSEKKSSSMLKMASSFFVVTVLAVAAVTVTKMDDLKRVRQTLNRSGNVSENEGQDNIYLDTAGMEFETDIDNKNTENRIAGGNLTASGGLTETNGASQSGEAGRAERMETAANIKNAGNTEGAENAEDTGVMESAGDAKDTGNTESTGTVEAAGGAGNTESVGNTVEAASGKGGNADSVTAQSESGNDGENNAVQTTSAGVRRTQALYIIREGDTLADICSKYYGNFDKLELLCKENGITDANMILPGQKIILP